MKTSYNKILEEIESCNHSCYFQKLINKIMLINVKEHIIRIALQTFKFENIIMISYIIYDNLHLKNLVNEISIKRQASVHTFYLFSLIDEIRIIMYD